MSGTIGGPAYGGLDRLLASAGSLREQYTTLQQQTTTGKISQSYAGLAPLASRVIDLTAASTENEAYTQAIVQAQGKASVMQDALSQIGTIVSTLSASALSAANTTTGGAVTSMAQQAGQALAQVVSLLNSKFGDAYVFSGADTANPPIPSPSTLTTSGMFTQIGAQVSALATVPTNPAVSTVIANTVSIASSTAAGTTVFSSYLTGAGAGAQAATIQIADSQQVTLDLPANKNVGGVSDPAINGTGNAISDIMRSLAVMANSTGAMATNPDFAKLINDAAATLSSAGTTLAQESGQIGVTQGAMTAASNAHASMKTMLATQITNLTDVDMATAISNLQMVNTQLQVSYKVLSEVQSMNLAAFL